MGGLTLTRKESKAEKPKPDADLFGQRLLIHLTEKNQKNHPKRIKRINTLLHTNPQKNQRISLLYSPLFFRPGGGSYSLV
jgi:hypothetical protein